MPPEEKDPAFLWDMREAARKLADLVLQTTEEEFPAAETLRFAVERLVLVLGEAAARVSETYRLQHPEIPWPRLQRLRNVVAHTYGKKAARDLYGSSRQQLVPLSIVLESPVTAPPPGRGRPRPLGEGIRRNDRGPLRPQRSVAAHLRT